MCSTKFDGSGPGACVWTAIGRWEMVTAIPPPDNDIHRPVEWKGQWNEIHRFGSPFSSTTQPVFPHPSRHTRRSELRPTSSPLRQPDLTHQSSPGLHTPTERGSGLGLPPCLRRADLGPLQETNCISTYQIHSRKPVPILPRLPRRWCTSGTRAERVGEVGSGPSPARVEGRHPSGEVLHRRPRDEVAPVGSHRFPKPTGMTVWSSSRS